MKEHNKKLVESLQGIRKDPAETSGAVKALQALKSAFTLATAAGAPWAPAGLGVIRVLSAAAAALKNGSKVDEIDLEKLMTTSATEDLKKKGITEDRIRKALDGDA